MKENSKIRNDLVFVAIILALCLVGFVYLFVLRQSGDVVKVTLDGKVYGIYSLSEDTVCDIVSGENGEKHNLMVVKDGKVSVADASCPDGICVSHRPVFRDGESIVCLPNKVVVSVELSDNDSSPDIVV